MAEQPKKRLQTTHNCFTMNAVVVFLIYTITLKRLKFSSHRMTIYRYFSCNRDT